jgi:hypothetical protein
MIQNLAEKIENSGRRKPKKMSIVFTFLSICYIAGIFLWADSPIVEELSAFNPYSLLHIPLYGILTILLIFSKLPFNFLNPTNQRNQVKVEDKVKVEVQRNQTNQINQTDQRNSINPSIPSNPRNSTNPMNHFIPGLISFVVAVADEIHQAYIPGRNASIIDVLLDLVGIVLVLIVSHQIRRKRLFTHSAAANRTFKG